MAEYHVDDEVRVAQTFLCGHTLPDGVRIAARPAKQDGEMCVQLTCHGPGGSQSVRRDRLGAWSEADEADKAEMVRTLIAGLADVS